MIIARGWKWPCIYYRASCGWLIAMESVAYILGYPNLRDVVRFVKENAVDSSDARIDEYANQWWRAHRWLGEAASGEADSVNEPRLRSLPDEMQRPAEKLLEHPEIHRVAHHLAYAWKLVDIDSLVVTQRFVNLRVVDDIRAAISQLPAAERLLDVASGAALARPSVHVTRSASGGFWISSHTAGLRFMRVEASAPEGTQAGVTAEQVCAGIHVSVGFGLNYLAAYRINGRLLLNNGTHRLCALRQLGIKSVPCLVLDVETEEQIAITLSSEILEHRDLYLRSPRPPVFGDYFNERLRAIIPTHRMMRVLRLDLTMSEERIAIG